jgi:hypothetical protein
VVHEDDLPRPDHPLADRQRPDYVVGDDAAGVAQDLGLAVLQPEGRVHVDPVVHARDHRHFGYDGGRRPGKARRVSLIVR